MSYPFRTQRRVEFADTDLAGIAHFTALFRYMETAEHELFRQLQLSVVMAEGADRISWPRVSAAGDFAAPVRFDDVVQIDVGVKELGEKSVTFAFVLSCEGRSVAEGRMTSVCCRLDPARRQLLSMAIPAAVREKLEGMRIAL